MEKGRWPLAFTVVLLSLIITAYVVMANVVFLYQATITVKSVSSPITVISGQCPCGCSSWSQTLTGFSTNITAYTLGTTSDYVLTTPLVKFNATVSGTLAMSLSSSSSVVSDYVNGTQIYPSPGSFSLSAGSYLMMQRLTLSSPVTSTLTLSGQYNYTYTPGVSFLYSFSETINPPSTNVMNLLNGQNAIYVPHVYQGVYQGSSNSSWPVYYGPSTASQYWSQGGISSNQPVLELAPAKMFSAGAMFWSETYSGSSVTITTVVTFSNGTSPPADGFEIYLFLKPTEWGISSAYNWSIPYTTSTNLSHPPSPIAGDIILPQSSASYIEVQWDPYWQIGYSTSNATGQWNVWIVSNPSGNNASITPSPSPNLGSSYAGWDGIGTGYFKPNPGDYICITVTYNPSTNTLSGVAYDLNTGQSASFTVNLGNNYAAPGNGSYVFGIGGGTGGATANWAVVYVNYQG